MFGGFANEAEVRDSYVAVHGVYDVSPQTLLDSRGIKGPLGILTSCHYYRCRRSTSFSIGRFGRFVPLRFICTSVDVVPGQIVSEWERRKGFANVSTIFGTDHCRQPPTLWALLVEKVQAKQVQPQPEPGELQNLTCGCWVDAWNERGDRHVLSC
jgi:hypothetical protein